MANIQLLGFEAKFCIKRSNRLSLELEPRLKTSEPELMDNINKYNKLFETKIEKNIPKLLKNF